jgi:hypothetical protein
MQVELKGDVQRAGLPDVQQYRDARLVVPAAITVCLVGGVDAETFFAEVERQLDQIKSQATPTPPVKLRTGNLDLTWDLDARHLVLTWPIPHFGQDDYAALIAAAQWLNMQFYSDAPPCLPGRACSKHGVVRSQGSRPCSNDTSLSLKGRHSSSKDSVFAAKRLILARKTRAFARKALIVPPQVRAKPRKELVVRANARVVPSVRAR